MQYNILSIWYRLSMPPKKWKLKTADAETVQRLIRAINCQPVTAAILAHRGIDTESKARQYFEPLLTHLSSPFILKDMHKAVSRICDAIIHKEKILIFGDYDVDGVTATTLLYRFLSRAGADVAYYIPHRITEGYGLKPQHISGYAVPNRFRVLVTVDCGSSNHDAVKLAQDAGIDVIVADHHEVPRILPPALAVINPKRRDCPSHLDYLAGVGVAFYLTVGVRKQLRDLNFWVGESEPNLKKSCDLVALGTVSDMVPLVNDNRILTKAGLEVIRSDCRVGIEAMLRACGLDNRYIDTEDIAYRIGPRINAAGRIDHAESSAELLITHDLDKARRISDLLNNLNAQRQREEQKALEQILYKIDRHPDLMLDECLVLADPYWHEGVLGIIASRLTKMYFRPVVLLSTDGETAKGSARSIPKVDLYDILVACKDMLVRFGGHSMAAGLQIRTDGIDEFRQAFQSAIAQTTNAEDFIQQVDIDYQLDLEEITPQLLDELELLKPFGTKNPEPLFLAQDIQVASSKIVANAHRRMQLKPSKGKSRRSIAAIQFNADDRSLQTTHFTKMAYRLQWNRWNGNKSMQIVVEEVEI